MSFVPVLVEDVFHPTKIEWLASHAHLLDAASKKGVYTVLSRAIAEHQTSSVSFLRECLLTLAYLGRKQDEAPPNFSATRSLCLQPALVVWTDNKRLALESLLRKHIAKPHDFRLYADYHTYTVARQHPWTVIDTKQIAYSNDAIKRIKLIIEQFAKETTFKVHADAGLHAEIITSVMAPFLSAGLVTEETPYQIAADVLADQVNDIVRPLLSTAVRDRIEKVRWDRPYVMGSIIVTASIMYELVGVKHVHLISNATLCKGCHTVPLLFVHRDKDGNGVVGIRYRNKFSTFSPDALVADILLKWVKDCEPCKIPQVSQLHEILFTDDIENNPLVKFLKKQ